MRNADSVPSTSTTVGLGRSFAWNQWARVNDVVDADFRVRRDQHAKFLAMAQGLRGADNALDARSSSAMASVPPASPVQFVRRPGAAVLD